MTEIYQNRKMCAHCGESLPESQFSLKLGKHSKLRKSYCKECEKKQKKKRKYGEAAEYVEQLFGKPCSICGAKSVTVDMHENKYPLGILCLPCSTTIRKWVENAELLKKQLLYFETRDSFPFWLRYNLTRQLSFESTPLLDYIDEREQLG